MRSSMRGRGVRMTDEWVTKDMPPYLRCLPARAGSRARVERVFPCSQVTQVDDPAAQVAVLRLVDGWPGVTVAQTCMSVPGCEALSLSEGVAYGQEEAFIMGGEFAHVRAEGSVHTTLAPEWAVDVMTKGWGEIHPLSLYGLIPPQNIVLYAPRHADELGMMERILAGAYSYACGRLVDLQL